MIARTPRLLLVGLCLALPSAAAAVGGGEPAPAELDLTTPRRATRAFFVAANQGDFAEAARVLDLRDLPEARRAVEGPLLARQLKFVLDEKLWVDWERVSDDPQGNPADGARAEVLGTIPIGDAAVTVRLARWADGSWHLGRGVVDAIPRLYDEYGPGWIGDRMPRVLIEVRLLHVQAWQWIGLAAALLLASFVGGALGAAGRRVALRLSRRTRVSWDEQLVRETSAPTRLLLAIATFAVATDALHLAVPAQRVVDHLLRIAATAGFCWAGLRALRFASRLLDERLARAGEQEGSARSRRTQLMVLRRVAGFVVIAVGSALVLLQFDAFRALGTSLLASASVLGIVAGLAAQRSLGTLFAGLQFSLTQPLRVGDIVVIEGEQGTIEEVTLTYVVVQTWDLRRLVVPITRFLDAPFQNWTRGTTDLLGTVLLHADYRVPVDAVRRELERFVRTRPEWDGKQPQLQVTSATDRTLELRALVSAPDSGRIWDLRCAVREQLVGFLQALEGGRYLPRTRFEGSPPDAPRAANGPSASG
ncbi:MAG TPA: mechanosensitive ion channel domain-containing protein [Anaeromyxobacter sp.]|nr:mechanosensitive ion channel domain-containing protein [Anaeromyxobacter sp.]